MAAPNADLMAVIVMRGGGRSDTDVICSGLLRLIAKAEAYATAGDADRQGFTLELIGEKLAELAAISADFQAAKAGAK